MNLNDIREKRNQAIADARKIVDKADSERRAMNASEDEAYERINREIDLMGTQIEGIEKNSRRVVELETRERALDVSRGRQTDPGQPHNHKEPEGDPQRRSQSLMMEVRATPGSGKMYEQIEFGPETRQWRLGQDFRRAAYGKWLREGTRAISDQELRDIQADSDVAGGYLAAPIQMVQQLLKFVDNAVIIRQKASVFQVPTALSLGVPTLDTDVADSDWTAELATGANDTAMAFGKRELHPHPLAKRVKVSNKLLRVAALGPEAIVRDRLGYKFAVSQEKAYMTGSGNQQPLGLFTASANGISTGRDVSTSNTANSLSADGLIEAKYSLKPQYQKTAEWLFHRDAIKMIRKLKDGTGQYLWQQGLVSGAPDTLLDRPVNQSEYVPNTFTTGKYVGLIGDFSFYWIADALNLNIQRLSELYAESNQTGFIGRLESDAQPVLEEAFSRLTLA